MNLAGVLALFAAEPTLLPAAPDQVTPQEIDQRRSELHTCALCKEWAYEVYVADTVAGLRWFDLCMHHSGHLIIEYER